MEHKTYIDRPWSVGLDEVLQTLQTSDQGLTDQEAAHRLTVFGRNAFRANDKKSMTKILIRQLMSPLVFILVGAALITAALGEWVEVAVITLAVTMNTALGFYREYHAENTLEKLSTYIKDRSRVIRGGIEAEVDSELLVPGDIVKLTYGSRVPADARIMRLNNVRIDESILTGESAPVPKILEPVSLTASAVDQDNMVHAGTLVMEGFATAVVVETGDRTEIGQIAKLVSSTHRAQTPIQTGLSKLAWSIFAVVIVLVVVIFLLGVSRGVSLFDMLILSAAVSVGAVPEALPIALTVILSIGAERIAKKRGIARTLIAAETLGSTSIIMTDKTGTLTEANMRLVGIYTSTELLSGSTEPSPEGDKNLLALALTNIDVLVENPEQDVSAWTFKGKPFEVNIAKTARDNGIDIARYVTLDAICIPFNSIHKFSVSHTDAGYIVMGAPDILLARSSMDAHTYQAIESWIQKASEEGKRLIALGKMPKAVSGVDDVQGIEFLGILAFHDPVRKEVPEAIRKIEALGTRVVMVTGDLKGTAMSVARELGWHVTDSNLLTGHDISILSDAALMKLLPSIRIFARVTPEDKLRIGQLYRKLGEVVAMTGDGVNDAPSLKAMDIGVAIGSGSDVAKSAADLVLLDDNFQIISLAIQEGRRILGNIQKTFVYLMSNSLDEVFVIGGSLLLGIALPLTALQIIWVNLFTGSLPALAFAYDEDFDHVAKKRTLKSLFTKEVNILTFGIGIASSLLLFFLYYGLIRYGIALPLARSVFFVCFASYILVVAYSFRSMHKPLFSYPLFTNKKLNQSILLAVAILIATVTLPVFQKLFDIAPIPFVWILFVMAWLLVNVLLVEGAKYLFRRMT
jgi:P-type Ca2+ transporter type 2C